MKCFVHNLTEVKVKVITGVKLKVITEVNVMSSNTSHYRQISGKRCE